MGEGAGLVVVGNERTVGVDALADAAGGRPAGGIGILDGGAALVGGMAVRIGGLGGVFHDLDSFAVGIELIDIVGLAYRDAEDARFDGAGARVISYESVVGIDGGEVIVNGFSLSRRGINGGVAVG